MTPGQRKRILSGVQPSGKLHLGNYFGAVKQHIALQTEGVQHAVAISGQSILLGANASNFGALYLMLKPFEERRSLSSDDIAARLQDELQKRVPRAAINIFGAPRDPELLKRYRDAGVDRSVLMLPPKERDAILPMLDQGAELIRAR